MSSNYYNFITGSLLPNSSPTGCYHVIHRVNIPNHWWACPLPRLLLPTSSQMLHHMLDIYCLNAPAPFHLPIGAFNFSNSFNTISYPPYCTILCSNIDYPLLLCIQMVPKIQTSNQNNNQSNSKGKSWRLAWLITIIDDKQWGKRQR